MMDGVQKSAILMLTIGQDDAAEIIKYLQPKEVQKLGEAMAGLRSVKREDMEEVIFDFDQQTQGLVSLTVDSNDFIRGVLTQALGEDKAASMLHRIMGGGSDVSGIEGLKWMDSAAVAELINNEHPQIIATILVHLERLHACEILTHFTERLRNDVILRIVTLEGIQPFALRELNEVMTKLLANSGGMRKRAMGGTRAVAEILNFIAPSDTERGLIQHIREYDDTLAQQVIDEMFVFDNLIDFDDRSMQVIIREVPQDALLIALKGAPKELREKTFKNMSQRAATAMREELDLMGPVRISDVTAKQREILIIVRRLIDEDQVFMPTPGGDDGFV
jgi:flagellar motor switch protein FliG